MKILNILVTASIALALSLPAFAADPVEGDCGKKLSGACSKANGSACKRDGKNGTCITLTRDGVTTCGCIVKP